MKDELPAACSRQMSCFSIGRNRPGFLRNTGKMRNGAIPDIRCFQKPESGPLWINDDIDQQMNKIAVGKQGHPFVRLVFFQHVLKSICDPPFGPLKRLPSLGPPAIPLVKKIKYQQLTGKAVGPSVTQHRF